MKDILPLLQIQDITWIAGVCVIIGMSLVQWLSKKYSPWSWLLERLGETMNKTMLDNQKRLEDKIDKLEQRLEENDARDAKNRAFAARRRILRFSDEIRKDEKHSLEYFNEVLNDIKVYKTYCKKHPDFTNDKAKMSIEIIEEVYKKCYKEDSFL